MGCVQIRENVYIWLSRRSLCDKLHSRAMHIYKGQRVTECDRFTPMVTAFKKCICCGEVFDVSANFQATDYDRCMKCNGHEEACVRA